MKKYLLLIVAAFVLVACDDGTKNCEVPTGTHDGMVLFAYDDGNGNSVEGTRPTDANGIATVSGVPNSIDCGGIVTKELPMYLD
ncbi:MAG: hypothetical protein ACJ741_15180 [Pyrinomonadaceae bacterium]